MTEVSTSETTNASTIVPDILLTFMSRLLLRRILARQPAGHHAQIPVLESQRLVQRMRALILRRDLERERHGAERPIALDECEERSPNPLPAKRRVDEN